MKAQFQPLYVRQAFPLVELKDPELYREQFPYEQIPRIFFDGKDVRTQPAAEIWITDTTFRDGQQARPPYAPEQIVRIFDFLHRLGGPKGIIRQCEFFLYSRRDAQALEGCLATKPPVSRGDRLDPRGCKGPCHREELRPEGDRHSHLGL